MFSFFKNKIIKNSIIIYFLIIILIYYYNPDIFLTNSFAKISWLIVIISLLSYLISNKLNKYLI
jgi:hypothetical protein